MGFVLDGILLLLIVASAILRRRQPVSASLLTLLAVIGAVTGAYFLSVPAAHPLAEYAVAPAVERTAANELADMVSVPHGETGRETAARLPVDRLLRDMRDPLSGMADRYGTSLDTLERADVDGTALLLALTADYSRAIARSLAFAVLVLLLFLLLRLLFRLVEMNLPPPKKVHGAARALPVLAGAFSGLAMAMAFGLLLEWLAPYAGQAPVLSRAVLDGADLHRLLQRINPFS